MRNLVFSCLLLFLAIQAEAQIPSSFSFFSGEWYTNHEWGEMTEYWSRPNGNTMMCAYQCVSNGKPVFYEFIVIEYTPETGTRLYLRHFAPRNIAREGMDGAVVFTVKESNDKLVVFQNDKGDVQLSYQLLDNGKLKAALQKLQDGQWTTTEFVYTKK